MGIGGPYRSTIRRVSAIRASLPSLPPAKVPTASKPPKIELTPEADQFRDYYGTTIPVAFGRRRITGEILWVGGGNFNTTTGVRSVDFAMSFGLAGSVVDPTFDSTQIIKLWANGQLIFDQDAEISPTSMTGLKFTTYSGTETQLQDPLIVADQGAANTPAFRGMVYVVFQNFDLSKIGAGRVPEIRAELVDVFNPRSEYRRFSTLTTLTAEPIDGDLFFFDKERYRAYAITPFNGQTNQIVLRTFDLFTDTEILQAELTPPIAQSLLGEVFRTITTVTQQGIAIHKPTGYIAAGFNSTTRTVIGVINPFTAQVITYHGPDDGDGGINSFSETNFAVPDHIHFADIKNGGSIETFIGAAQRTLGPAQDFGILSMSANGELLYVDHQTDAITGSVTCMSPAEDRSEFGEAAWYVGTDEGGLWKVTVTAGSVSGAANVIVEQLITFADDVVANLLIDDMDDNLIVVITRVGGSGAGDGDIYKYVTPKPGGVATLTQLWLNAGLAEEFLPATSRDEHVDSMADTSAGTFGYDSRDANRYVILETSTGEVRSYDNSAVIDLDTETSIGNPVLTADYWDSRSRGSVGDPGGANEVGRFWPNRFNDDTITLGKMIELMGVSAGYQGTTAISATPDMTFVDNLNADNNWTTPVVGALFNVRTEFTQVVRNISILYDFNFYEDSGLIKFVRTLTDAAVATNHTMDISDLGSLSGSDDDISESISVAISSSESLPRGIELRYVDPNNDFLPSVQIAQRTNFPFRSQETRVLDSYQLPFVVSPIEALELATDALYRIAQAAITFEFRTGFEFMIAAPGDIVVITNGAETYTLKISSTTHNADYSVTMQGEQFLIETDKSFASFVNGGTVVGENGILGPSWTSSFLMDTPYIIPTQDLAGTRANLNFAFGPFSDQANWPGARFVKSLDGLSFEEVNTDDTGVLYGTTLTAMIDTDNIMQIDPLQSVTIQVFSGDTTPTKIVSAVDRAEFVSRDDFNLCAVREGQIGDWEFFQFETAVDNGGGSFTLSGLVRGRRGSDAFVQARQAGSTWMFVDFLTKRFTDPFDVVGNPMFFKAIPTSGSGAEVPQQFVSVVGNSLKPWAPGAFRKDTALWGANIVLSWDYRNRRLFNSPANEFPDGTFVVPLDESSELYDLDIINESGIIVARGVDLTSAAYTYLIAEQNTDFPSGDPGAITVNVYQKNTLIGRGLIGVYTIGTL